MAQTTDTYLSSQMSDPVKMGWMQGFSPPKDKVLSTADGSFFTFPALRYSVVHMREFLPTVSMSPGLGAPSALPVALDPAIDAVTFRPRNANQPMNWAASLEKNYTDGILILHPGRVVYERYFAALTPPISMP